MKDRKPAQSTLVKELLISWLGMSTATWIHALRLAWLARGRDREAEMTVLSALVQPGTVAIDVGANGADWTLALSRAVGREGLVFAFEADPYYAGVTRKCISLLRLRNVTFFPFGLGDTNTEERLLVVDEGGQRVSGRGRVVPRPTADEADRCEVVSLRILDDISHECPRLRQLTFLKIDVEGFELMVLRGAFHLIRDNRPIIVAELGHAGLHGYETQDIFNFLEPLGYRCFQLSRCRVRLREVLKESPETHLIVGNVLFIPAAQVAQIENRLSGWQERIGSG